MSTHVNPLFLYTCMNIKLDLFNFMYALYMYELNIWTKYNRKKTLLSWYNSVWLFILSLTFVKN